MTSSEGHEEGVPGGVAADDGDRKAGKQAAKAEAQAAKAARKAAKREARTAARSAKAAAKAEAKAAKSAKAEAKAQVKAERAAAEAAARSEAKAAKTAQANAKAEAREANRAAKAQASAARAASPVVAHASALLEEAAQLIRQSGAPAPAADDSIEAHEPGPAAPDLEVATTDLASELAGDAAPAAVDDLEAADGDAGAADGPSASEPADTAEPADAPLEPLPPEAPALELTAGGSPVALLAPETGGPAITVPADAQVAASVDIGSTSVHLLVGAVDGHRVTPLLDESVFLGLGDRVGAAGYFGDEVRAALVADLERYVAAARDLGAVSVTIVGTEPMRRAADAGAVIHELAARTGAPVHVLDHDEEGLLTLIGATGGSPVSGELLLVDIGGGSTEFVVVGTGRPPRTVGLPLGAARLTRELVRSDPPSLREIEALRQGVDAIVGGAPEASPSEIVAVGGTASNLLRLLPATAVDRSLTRRRISVALAMLTVERSSEAATRHVIRPERARILPAGAIIVDAILERYRADRLRVSEAGIREGAILAAVRGGAAWRDRLGDLARGWHERPGS